MASWVDVFSLVMTTLFFVGAIVGILYVAHFISSRIQSTQASLEQRGITLSREGVSVKTQRRFDRDDYLDATQRGLVKALGAATVGSESHKHTLLPPQADRDRDRWHLFGMALRRSHSGERPREEFDCDLR